MSCFGSFVRRSWVYGLAALAAAGAGSKVLGQTQIQTHWIAGDGDWRTTANWDNIPPGQAYPYDGAGYAYLVTLPTPQAGAYIVTANNTNLPGSLLPLTALTIEPQTTLAASNITLRPGQLTVGGTVVLEATWVEVSGTVTNDGVIARGPSTARVRFIGSSSIVGSGSLSSPGSEYEMTVELVGSSASVFTNGPGHTIGGGWVTIQGGNTFINQGSVVADAAGRTVTIGTTQSRLTLNNQGTLAAQDGGTLLLTNISASSSLGGALSIGPASTIRVSSLNTPSVTGVIDCDGLLEFFHSVAAINGATGGGDGELRLDGSSVTVGSSTDLSFASCRGVAQSLLSLQSGTFRVGSIVLESLAELRVAAGRTLEVRDHFSHSINSAARFTWGADSRLRITGGVDAGPTEADRFASVEAASQDRGDIAAGYTSNFALARLVVAPGAKVNIFDVLSSGNRGGQAGFAEALYVDTLEFQDGAGLVNLNGHHLYFHQLVGSSSQIIDLGGGAKLRPVEWTCPDGLWTDTSCWSGLAPGDPYPNSAGLETYSVSLPQEGSAYVVTVPTQATGVSIGALQVTADAALRIEADDFAMGTVNNEGSIILAGDDLQMSGLVVNDGTVSFPDPDNTRDIYFLNSTTLSGTGTLRFRHFDHLVMESASTTVTNSVGHRIEGGGGVIGAYLSPGRFVNDGIVHAGSQYESLDILCRVTNHGLLEAENGGIVRVAPGATSAFGGTVHAATDSTFTVESGTLTTTTFTGTAQCEGTFQTSGGQVFLSNAGVTGPGVLRCAASHTTLGPGTGVQIGTLRAAAGELAIQPGSAVAADIVMLDSGSSFTIEAGGVMTARSRFTSSIADRTVWNLADDATFIMTGGTGAGPDDFEAFGSIEAGSRDDGGAYTNPAFFIPHLVIAPGAKINVFDAVNNGGHGGDFGFSEAIYVGTLEFQDAGGRINLNGHHLYYGALVGNPAQIIDSGGGSGKSVPVVWTCGDGAWGDSACWSGLPEGAPYPDNSPFALYFVDLPESGTPYLVTGVPGAGTTDLASLSVAPAATLSVLQPIVASRIDNRGLIRIDGSELAIERDSINDGVISFDADSNTEFLTFRTPMMLSGNGQIVLPETSVNSPAVRRVQIAGTLVLGSGQRIEGTGTIGPSGPNTTVLNNHGAIIANVSNRQLVVSALRLTSTGSLRAENGGTLQLALQPNSQLNGLLSCAPGATVVVGTGQSLVIRGQVIADGLLQFNSQQATLDGVSGVGSGELRTVSGDIHLTSGSAPGVGVLNLQSGVFTMDAGTSIGVSSSLSNALNAESGLSLAAGSSIRITGGVGANPCSTESVVFIEAAGTDRGNVPQGFTGNFQLPHLVIAAGAQAKVFDSINNGNRNGVGGAAEALYVNTLEFEDSTGRLNPNGLHIYYQTLIGDPSQIGLGGDCNANGTPDACDIASGASMDSNANGVPDECECFCDWNGVNGLNSQDFFDFLTAFFSSSADFNRDGATNSQDFFDFLGCFFAPPPGCH